MEDSLPAAKLDGSSVSHSIPQNITSEQVIAPVPTGNNTGAPFELNQQKLSSGACPNSTKVPCIPEGWTRCHAYIPRKCRFCRQMPLPTSQFCGNHQPQSSQSTKENENDGRRKRVRCPLDPTHDIYEDQLEIHVSKCPKRKAEREQENFPYFRRNCNCGGHGERLAKRVDYQKPNIPFAIQLAKSVLVTHQKLFQGSCNPTDSISNLTSDEIIGAIPLEDMSQGELHSLSKAVSHYRIRSGGDKHLYQQASLIGHLRRLRAFDDHTNNNHVNDLQRTQRQSAEEEMCRGTNNSTHILELGAGRTISGLVIAGVAAKNSDDITLTMVERGTARGRADKILRKVKAFPSEFPDQSYMHLSNVRHWNRVRCDLAHVDMSSLFIVQPSSRAGDNGVLSKRKPTKKLIVLAKHLCGVGTDLALKALEPIRHEISVCIMSTCCHGICLWSDYVGRDWLKERMVQEGGMPSFGELEVDLLRFWSGATVKDDVTMLSQKSAAASDRLEENEHSHQQQLSVDQRASILKELFSDVTAPKVAEAMNLQCGAQGLGRACQRLIDYGRQEYMRRVLFADTSPSNVRLLYYVPTSVSPQNAMLVANR
jgi:tRNA:m4X modification enzyme